MSDILNALGEFRKILVDFKGLLQADVNRASGVIPPSTPSSTNNPSPTTPQLDVEAIKQDAINEYIKKEEEEKAKDDDTNFKIGTGVGVAAAVLGGLYLFSKS
jgi:hypothetical protein